MRVREHAAPPARALQSSLVLVINQTFYRVRALHGESGAEDRAFRLNKADGTLYDVAQTRYGPRCDCPDFVFRRDGIDPAGCKHVRALVAEGLIEGLRTPVGAGQGRR
jgi:hypothetical protein